MKGLYQNFWIRNLALLLLLASILFDSKNTAIESTHLLGGLLVTYIQISIHNIFLYRRQFVEKKYNQYVLRFILLWFSFLLITYYTPYRLIFGGIGSYIVGTLIMYVFGLGFYFIHKNIIQKSISIRTELIGKNEEIRYLKAQLNPHFLFNALNNLYGVALSSPEETATKILELSELLRYQIEASQKETALVTDEINYINKYFSYERNRNPKLKISFKQAGSFIDLHIAPLLFMPFIENAIKYSAEAEGPMIEMELTIQGKTLSLRLLNNFNHSYKKLIGTNTGIANTKKRLALVYGKKHQLRIKDENNMYDVQLTLEL